MCVCVVPVLPDIPNSVILGQFRRNHFFYCYCSIVLKTLANLLE